jgi:hypothetical protein
MGSSRLWLIELTHRRGSAPFNSVFRFFDPPRSVPRKTKKGTHCCVPFLKNQPGSMARRL